MSRAYFSVLVFTGALVVAAACGGSLPQPSPLAQPSDAFAEVPYPPPPAKVEYLPDRPRNDALWVNGQWQWQDGEWRWQHGGWYAVPAGVGFARWETRRDSAGRLLFAPATWRDQAGREVGTPALLVRASAGPDGLPRDAGEDEPELPAEAGLADAPTIFDGPLFDAAPLRVPVLTDGAPWPFADR